MPRSPIRLRSRQFCIPQRHDISHRMKMQGKIPSYGPLRCRQNGKDACRYRLQWKKDPVRKGHKENSSR